MAGEAERPARWWLSWILGAVMIVGGAVAGDAVASFVALGQGDRWLIAGIHAGRNYSQGNVSGLPFSGNPAGDPQPSAITPTP